VVDPSSIEQRAAALLQLSRWLEEPGLAACFCYTDGELSPQSVIDELSASPAAAEFQQVRIAIGPRYGTNFARDFILCLAAALWPDDGPFTAEPIHLRQWVLSQLWNWSVDNERPLLLIVSDLDLCLDASAAGGAWRFGELGEGVRALFSLSVGREAMAAWVERLSLPVTSVAFVALDVEATTDAARRAREASVSANGFASELLCALGALATSLEPISLADLARTIGLDEHAVGQILDAEAVALREILDLAQLPQRIRFRDREQQASWAALVEPSVRAGARRLHDAALAYISKLDAASLSSAYFRRNAVAHLFIGEAPTGVLVRVCEPEWCWPSSLDDLVDRRSDLDHVRLRCVERTERKEHSAIVGLTSIALAQGALSSLLAADWPSSGRGKLRGPGEDSALFGARSALAQQASQTVADRLRARADERALLSYEEWTAPGELVALAEGRNDGLSSTIAGRAVEVLRASDGGLLTPLSLRVARLLPESHSAALLTELVGLIRTAAEPSKALTALLRPSSATEPVKLEATQVEALFQMARTLSRNSAANALALLFPSLEGDAKIAAIDVIYEVLLDDVDAEAASDEPSASESFDATLALDAVASSLTEQQTLRLVDNPRWSGLGEGLARRLAELGRTERIPEVVTTLCGEGGYAGPAWLLASAASSDHRLDSEVLAVLDALDDAQRLGLVTRYPAAALRLVGVERAIEFARAASNSSGYACIAALAALCLASPTPDRPLLAELAAQAYFDDWDTDALELVVGVSAWFSADTALRLYASAAGIVADGDGISVALQGWGGVQQLAPLLARIAGDPLLEAVCAALDLVERWAEYDAARTPS
jgi:hypothetical protein